ncbi:hypothetical protein CA13_18240 [Planctomycetes bacterium CA13]|uniref:Uncharacterized protein n=1 Tax=Novipirellula herctigrandis TaxID=2527986 RepID=A0A5C5YZ81_9BACT|nr:hypothetical protein CA13_18240 [Planctomycetes bacterium CA13]
MGPWPTRFLRFSGEVVPIVGNKLPVPTQACVRHKQSANLCKLFAAEEHAIDGRATTGQATIGQATTLLIR